MTLLDEARERVGLLTASLPTIIDAGSFRTATGQICRSKAPTIALTFRETQAWRVEEFARTACDAIERDDLAVGATCARHMMESCAAVWYLRELMLSHIGEGISQDDLHKKLDRLFLGVKEETDVKIPRAVHVNDFLRKLDKAVPGVFYRYNQLSEIAHPNWSGSARIYAKRSEDNFTTYFGRTVRDNTATKALATTGVIGGLDVFSYAYNSITDQIPAFVQACERSLDRPPADAADDT